MILLATAAPSEELSDVYLEVAIGCFWAAAAFSVLSLLVYWASKKSRAWPLSVAVSGILLGIYPVIFSAYVLYIDRHAREGESALWPFEALALPAAPIYLSLIVIWCCRSRQKLQSA